VADHCVLSNFRGQFAGEKMSEEIDPIEDRYSAVHEAGHAIAAILLDLGLLKVSIGKRRLPGGMLIGGDFKWSGVTLPDLAGKGDLAIPLITLYLAGPVAEMKINPKAFNPAAPSDDFLQALKMAKYASGEDFDFGGGHHEVRTTQRAQLVLYQKGRDAAGVLLDEHWPMIEALADLLQVRRSMSGSEVEDFMRDRDRPDHTGSEGDPGG
jgi:hypothetical protein